MFRIGQKVVSVVDYRPANLTKGMVVIITDLFVCKCGCIYVSWGAFHGDESGECVMCGKTGTTNTVEHYIISSSFRPLQYSTNCNKEIIEKFSPLEEKSDVQIREYEPVKTSLLK